MFLKKYRDLEQAGLLANHSQITLGLDTLKAKNFQYERNSEYKIS